MSIWREFLMVATAHLLAVMSPGPDFAMICRNSLGVSRRAGILCACGLGLGILVHVTLALLGLTCLVQRNAMVYQALRWAGGAYLVGVGLKSLGARPPAPPSGAPAAARHLPWTAALRSGFLTNILNPKAMLFFLALFTVVISARTPRGIRCLYGLEMSLVTFLWFAFVACVLSGPRVRGRFMARSHWIERSTGLVLVALGIRVAFWS